jgi:hypothetical protein
MTDATHGGAGPDRSVLDDIEKNGVQLFFDEDEESGSSRAFTLGLWHLRQRPEVVALGLPEDLAVQVLELVIDDVEDGVVYEAGQKHEGIVHGYPVWFGKVRKEQAAALLPELASVYGDVDVPVLQLVYPDKQGRWPWDADVREGFRDSQPVLERIDDAASGD